MEAIATIEEVQIVRMAKEFHGEVLAAGTTVLSDLATRLAKLLYDDDLILFGEGLGTYDCPALPKLEDEEYLAHGAARAQLRWDVVFDIVASDRYRMFTGPVQVDRRGNANISVIGPWDRPAVQLIGSRGMPDDLWRLSIMNFHVPKHSTRSIVERVDFVSSFGYGEAREALRKSGVRKEPMKPNLLVTDLGVFTWDESVGEIQVESLHPGVEAADVAENTGFELDIPADVPTTELPTAEELDAIRNVIDPWGFRHGTDAASLAVSRLVGQALVPNADNLRSFR